jgi:Holliday junction resolvase
LSVRINGLRGTGVRKGIGVVYKKVDTNQTQIVKELRRVGMDVQHLHGVHHGCPDILVGYRGRNILLEIKKDEKAKLTPEQVIWHKTWRGQVAVVSNPQAAIRAVRIACSETIEE